MAKAKEPAETRTKGPIASSIESAQPQKINKTKAVKTAIDSGFVDVGQCGNC